MLHEDNYETDKHNIQNCQADQVTIQNWLNPLIIIFTKEDNLQHQYKEKDVKYFILINYFT